MFDINEIEAKIKEELASEKVEAAKVALKAKYVALAAAEKVAANIKLEIEALKKDIALDL